MQLDDTTTTDEMLGEQLANPGFRAEWERTALARAVGLRLVRYRAERDLSQRDLARILEMEQPQVARLERGDVNPSIPTLMRLAGALNLEFAIGVRPSGRSSRLLTKRAQDHASASYESGRAVASVSIA
jgi:transcriptional regulator with XRE-family HTH domain